MVPLISALDLDHGMCRSEALQLTSGRSALSGLSNISHNTSTGVFGFIAMPACMPRSWIYFMSSLGDVLDVDVPEGVSAAVESMAAS